MEHRNKGRVSTPVHHCMCVFLCAQVCASALPKADAKPVLRRVSSQFHSLHFHKQPTVGNVKPDLITPFLQQHEATAIQMAA